MSFSLISASAIHGAIYRLTLQLDGTSPATWRQRPELRAAFVSSVLFATASGQ